MDVYGLDFTSRPTRGKPIICLRCQLDDGGLRAVAREAFADFGAFELMLRRPGPWIAGLDFPFGLPRKFIEGVGWPQSWEQYVRHAWALERDGFRAALEDYRHAQPAGDKEHRRATDVATGAISPQKLYGTPVALMFFEGAPRLIRCGVTIPLMQAGDPERIVIETYPGLLARQLIGRRSYKNDASAKQTAALYEARRAIIDRLCGGALRDDLSFDVRADARLCDDPSGDELDALLCAVLAAWAWQKRMEGYGAPPGADPLEGWIVDPFVNSRASPTGTS